METLEQNYILTKKTIENNVHKIVEDISSSSYPNTGKALLYCQLKIQTLLNSMMVITSNKIEDVYYSTQVLMRVIYEHFLVGHYIWTKARLTTSDLCATEYYIHYRLSEIIKREYYELGIEGIESKISKNATFQTFKEKFKDAPHPIAQSDVEETHRIGNQFDIKSILNYVLNEVPENDHFYKLHKTLAQFLREYNKLSSFIHNGPSAEFETYHNEPPIDKINKVQESLKFAKISVNLIREHLLMLLCLEKIEYNNLLQPIMDLKKGDV